MADETVTAQNNSTKQQHYKNTSTDYNFQESMMLKTFCSLEFQPHNHVNIFCAFSHIVFQQFFIDKTFILHQIGKHSILEQNDQLLES